MTRINKIAALALICLMFAACGGKKQPVLSPVEAKIAGLSAMGSEAFEKGDFDRAHRLYTEALKHAVSIERTRSIAVNTINASNTLRMLGRYKEADELLEPIAGEGVLVFSSVHRSKAAYLRATLRIVQGNPEGALDWCNRAIEVCVQSKCKEAVGVHVTMARAYLMMDDNESAIKIATRAVSMASSAKRKPERASAIAVQAEALQNLGDSTQALKLYDEAVRLNKELGISTHIADNLYGSARALESLGRVRDAEVYYYRAFAVSTASDNKKMMKMSQDALHRLNP